MGFGEICHAVYHHLCGGDNLLLVADLLDVGPGDGYHPEERHERLFAGDQDTFGIGVTP